jgi:hypothetical protein
MDSLARDIVVLPQPTDTDVELGPVPYSPAGETVASHDREQGKNVKEKTRSKAEH